MQVNLGNDEKLGITKVDEGRRGSTWMNADETGIMMNDDGFYGIPRIGWNDQGGPGSIWRNADKSGGMTNNDEF